MIDRHEIAKVIRRLGVRGIAVSDVTDSVAAAAAPVMEQIVNGRRPSMESLRLLAEELSTRGHDITPKELNTGAVAAAFEQQRHTRRARRPDYAPTIPPDYHD